MPGRTLKSNEQWLLLDTNVIEYFVNDERHKQIRDLVQRLIDVGFVLCISDITVHELLSGADAKTSAVMENVLDPEHLNTFPVSHEVITLSAQLASCYIKNEITKQDMARFSVGDRLIASTAILNDAVVLTGDSQDFPWPFFHEAKTFSLSYQAKRSKRKQLFHLTIKVPHLPSIQSNIDDHKRDTHKERNRDGFNPLSLQVETTRSLKQVEKSPS